MFINFKQLSNNIADIRSYIGHLYVGRVLGRFDQGCNQFPCRFGVGESLGIFKLTCKHNNNRAWLNN